MNSLVEHANKVIRDNPDKVQQARGNPTLTAWFVGKIRQATNGGYSEDEIYHVLERRGLKKACEHQWSAWKVTGHTGDWFHPHIVERTCGKCSLTETDEH